MRVVVDNLRPGDVFRFSAAEIERLSDAMESLASAEGRLSMLRTETRGALAARDELWLDAVAIMQSTADRAVATPAATDLDLIGIGLAPRRGNPSRPLAPTTVTHLRAVPDTFGGVRLTWDKEDNPRTATYVVEWCGSEGEWRYLTATPRKSFRAGGFPPGVPALFRVTAKTAVRSANPCAPVAVYDTPVAARRAA